MRQLWTSLTLLVAVFAASSAKSGGTGGWNTAPDTQYHIQTDEGPERYFRYQTISGQYRKEKRLQDGTVVGTYGWVDPNGFLRLRDYVADNNGYRVVKTKMVYVGKDEPIGSAVSKSKNVPAQAGTSVVALRPGQASYSSPSTATPAYATTPAPVTSPPVSYSNPFLYQSQSYSPPSNSLSPPYNPQQSYYSPPSSGYPNAGDRSYDSSYQNIAQFPLYDGVSATHNGFRYYLPRHYHEEESLPGDKRSGSFGYIDPFGIRRVIYYNTAPGSGFVHRKNNRYVGFNAQPYDPRF